MPKTRHLRLQYVFVEEGVKSKVSFNAKVQWSQAYSDELLCVFLPELLHSHGMRFRDSGKIRFILTLEVQRLPISDDILVLTGSHVKIVIQYFHMVST